MKKKKDQGTLSYYNHGFINPTGGKCAPMQLSTICYHAYVNYHKTSHIVFVVWCLFLSFCALYINLE